MAMVITTEIMMVLVITTKVLDNRGMSKYILTWARCSRQGTYT